MADALEILLIEDNPGDARLIEEMLGDAGELLERIDPGTTSADETHLRHETRLADGLDRLSDDEADVGVVLLDLNLPDSAGLDTLAAVTDSVEWTPVVVLTGLSDERTGIEAIQEGAQDYLVKDEVTADLLVRSIHHAIERNRQERERARRREQLEALNRLNRIGQDVTHAVITTSTREQLEQAVCDRLVASEDYRFAWIGGIDRASDRVVPRAAAGVEEGYLDEITITIDDGETAEGPAGRAVREQSVQVMQNVQTDPEFEPWRAEAEARGYRSSAAIPLVYEDLLYGVLNVYADSPRAFSEPERGILSRLGDVIGHAITAIERKDALVSDTVLELEFRAESLFEELVGLSAERDCVFAFDNLIRSDDALIVYGELAAPGDGVTPEEFREVVDRSPSIEDARILSPDSDRFGFELVTEIANDLVDAIGTHGGQLESAAIRDGECRFVVEFPPGRDKRQLVDLVETHCPEAESYAQRTVERDDRDVTDSRSVLHDRLTDKQRTALETAYFAGLFDWPRKSTGQEVAERLGITPATFTQHLRAAEKQFFDAVFESED